MHRTFYLFISCVLLFLQAFSQKIQEPGLHSLILEGIDLTLKQEYGRADSVFRISSMKYPDHPAGYLYQAAVLQTRAIDYVIPLDRKPFDSLLAIGEKLSEKIIEQDPSSPRGYYFLGTTYGYDAYARVENGDWFGGVRKGFGAVSEFKKVVEQDSLFYDALAGVGTFYYWRSRKLEFLNWLPFISDDRKEGITLLRRCAEYGTYNRFPALSALVTIYLDAEEYQQSVQAAKLVLARYPTNRIFLWGLADALEKSGNFNESLTTYENLLAIILRDKIPNPYSEILCRFNMVKILLTLNESIKVPHHLRALLSYEHHKFPENIVARVKAKFREARTIEAHLRNHRTSGNEGA